MTIRKVKASKLLARQQHTSPFFRKVSLAAERVSYVEFYLQEAGPKSPEHERILQELAKAKQALKEAQEALAQAQLEAKSL